MPAPTERQIRDSIVALIASVIGTGKVYNRIRFARNNAEYVALYTGAVAEGEPPLIHVYFVRRVAKRLEITGFDDIVARTHTYEIRGMRGLVDSDEDSLASENIFQAELEAISDALDADKHLGFGEPSVSHSGFEIPTEMPDVVELGDYKCHGVQARVSVRVEEC
jgi:hypothetical protein